MKCLFDVTVQVFAAGGDVIRVEAANETEAGEKAKKIATQRFNDDLIKCDLQEVVENCVEQISEEAKPKSSSFEAVALDAQRQEYILHTFTNLNAGEAYDAAERLCNQVRALSGKPVFVREITGAGK